MTIDLISLLKILEGFSLSPYLDSLGYPTIGYGNRTYPDGKKVTMSDPPITKEYAEAMLTDYCMKSVYPVFAKIPYKLSQTQKAGLGALIYNVGETSFLKSKLYKAICKKDNPNIFREWNWGLSQNLTKRRVTELYWWFY